MCNFVDLSVFVNFTFTRIRFVIMSRNKLRDRRRLGRVMRTVVKHFKMVEGLREATVFV